MHTPPPPPKLGTYVQYGLCLFKYYPLSNDSHVYNGCVLNLRNWVMSRITRARHAKHATVARRFVGGTWQERWLRAARLT